MQMICQVGDTERIMTQHSRDLRVRRTHKLLREAVVPVKLGVSGQLGRTSWLLGATSDTPFEDLVFDPQDEARK